MLFGPTSATYTASPVTEMATSCGLVSPLPQVSRTGLSSAVRSMVRPFGGSLNAPRPVTASSAVPRPARPYTRPTSLMEEETCPRNWGYLSPAPTHSILLPSLSATQRTSLILTII